MPALFCLLFLATGLWMPEPAGAYSSVYSIPGQVGYLGDDEPHELQVWDGPRLDVQDWSWTLGAGAAGAATALRIPELRIRIREIGEYIRAAANGGAEISPEPPGMPPELQQLGRDLDTVTAARRAAQDRIDDLYVQINNALHRNQQPAQALIDSLDQALAQLDQHAASADDIVARVAAMEQTLAGARADWALDVGFAAGNQAHAARLGRRMIVIFGELLAIVDGWWSISQMFSANRVFLQDSSGDELDAWWPCREVVRKPVSGLVGNTVACPVANVPQFLSPWQGRVAGLYVQSGNGNDDILIGLSPEANPFRTVVIEGRGGTDRIRGGLTDDRIFGGGGPDTIYGDGGDDTLYGHGPTYVSTGSEGPTDNDRLFGGPGEDHIEGEQGHDLIFGAGGDDPDLDGGTGNDAIVGGAGKDNLVGGPDRDSLFAKESDFPVNRSEPAGPKKPDEIDHLIGCGATGASNEYSTSIAAESEHIVFCNRTPSPVQTATTLIDAPISAQGNWPWYGP